MILLALPLAVAATILTYAVSYRVLTTFTLLQPPRLIAAIVAILSGLSLLSLGGGVIPLLLIPCAALGLSLPIVLLLKWLMRGRVPRDWERWRQDHTSGRRRRRPGPGRQPGSRNASTSAHLRDTPPTKE